MKPGPVRLAVHDAARRLAPASATWVELSREAGLEPEPRVRHVVVNMLRTGDLARVGVERVPHARRPMVRVAVATCVAAGGLDLAAAWGIGRGLGP